MRLSFDGIGREIKLCKKREEELIYHSENEGHVYLSKS